MAGAVRGRYGQKAAVDRDICGFSSFSYKSDGKIYYIRNRPDIIDGIYLRTDFRPVPGWKETGMDEPVDEYGIGPGHFKGGRGYTGDKRRAV